MFDPSQQLHDYFVQKGHSDLEAHKLANKVSGRCPVGFLAHNQTATQPRNAAGTQHMAEQTAEQPDSEIIDLGFDVTEADVARPKIKPGRYNANISFVRKEPSRQKGLPTLLVGYRLIDSAKTIDGKEVGAGFTITQRILMSPTGGLTQQMIDDRLKRVHFAAVGPGRVTTAGWVGKLVDIRVTLREPHRDETTGEEYDASNDIGGVYPPSKSVEVEV